MSAYGRMGVIAEPTAWRGAALALGTETSKLFITARLPPKRVLNRRLPGTFRRVAALSLAPYSIPRNEHVGQNRTLGNSLPGSYPRCVLFYPAGRRVSATHKGRLQAWKRSREAARCQPMELPYYEAAPLVVRFAAKRLDHDDD